MALDIFDSGLEIFGHLRTENDGTKTTIMGITGDYNRIGDAGVTSQALASEDDLLVTGKLEVNGLVYLDGGLGAALDFNNQLLSNMKLDTTLNANVFGITNMGTSSFASTAALVVITSGGWYGFQALTDGGGEEVARVTGTATAASGRFQLKKGQLTGDLDANGYGGLKHTFLFVQDNVAAGQAAVSLKLLCDAVRTEGILSFPGSIIGIRVYSNEARTAGTLTVDVTVDGAVTGLQAILDATNTQDKATTQAKDLDAFTNAQRIGVKITTSADWAPTTADIEVAAAAEY